jgi:S1-C subfamily serine protease
VVTESASSGEGLLVTRVVAGGSAFLAGVQQGDIIDHINFTEVTSHEELASALSAVFPGDNVPLQLTRSGARVNLVASAAANGVPLQTVRDLRRVASGQVNEHDLREHKALEASHPVALAPVLHGHDAVQDDETEARAQLVATSRSKFSSLKADVGVELEETDGSVRISKLVAGGGAAAAGVRVGDKVNHVNFVETSSIDDFNSALLAVLPGDSVPFQLLRTSGTGITGERVTLIVQAGAVGVSAAALRDLRRLAAGVVHDHDLHHQ